MLNYGWNGIYGKINVFYNFDYIILFIQSYKILFPPSRIVS